jgi:ubiquinone/menaquinone biosynthesis C-methylase UbiE
VSRHREQSDIRTLPEDFYERVREHLWQRIVEELYLAERIVEIGCGSCELASFLAEKNDQHVIGVDISGSGFPRDEDAQGRIECRQADGRDLDFIEDRSVDAVLSVHALHEIHEPVEVLREANRILRDGGEMLVVDFPRDSLAQRLWNEDYYASTEVAGMLDQAGFAAVESRLIARSQLIWAQAREAPAGREMP